MPRFAAVFAVFAAVFSVGACVFVVGACATAATASSRASPESLRALSKTEKVKALLEQGIGDARPDVVDALLGPSYRQHNPRVADGRGGLLGYVTWLQSAPHSERVSVDVVRVFEDGDFAFAFSHYVRHGHDVVGVDVFRFDGEFFGEHWDAGEVARGDVFGGPVSIDEGASAEASKAVVASFVDRVFIGHDDAGFDVVAADVIQHEEHLGAGRDGWRAGLVGTRHEVKRTLAQGDFVLVLSHVFVGDTDAAVYDWFRVKDGAIVEHWQVSEAVPKEAANANTMF